MKIRKFLLIILLFSFGLTGCYTQLEYSQKVNRITEEKPVEGYAWDEDSEEQEKRPNLTVADSIYIAETYGAKVDPYREEEYDEYADEEYIPVEYKDYSVMEQYEACGCNPYKTYVIYDSYYPSSSLYFGTGHFYSHRYHWRPYGYRYHGYYSPFYRWHWMHHMGFKYYHRGFGLAFHWGSPYYYYDPFFYDPFYYGYHRPIYYNNYFFGSYAGKIRSDRSDRRYGPRSIGADRVRDRNSSTIRTRTGVSRSNGSATKIRSRSTGVQRSRGTIQNTRSSTTRSRGTTRVGNSSRSRSDSGTKSRGTVTRSRSNDNGNGNRSRSRSGVQRDRNDGQASVSTTRKPSSTRKAIILPPSKRAEIERRISQQRAKQVESSRRSSSRRSFFGRLNSILSNGSRAINSNRNSSRSRSFKIPNRSKTRSSFGRSRSSGSSSRSTVKRSRSSSKSSSSRSRSSSSNKKRSRNNN